MQPGLCVIIVLGFCVLWFILKESDRPEYYYQVPNPQWKYFTKNPTPQDEAAATDLADCFFTTKRNTLTSTLP